MRNVFLLVAASALLLPAVAADSPPESVEEVPCVVVTLSPPDAYLTEPCVVPLSHAEEAVGPSE